MSKKLKTVSSPSRRIGLETAEVVATTPSWSGSAPDTPSRAMRHVAVVGREQRTLLRSVTPGIESIIGPRDDRVRILETDLSPWRAICALQMRGALGAGVIGTGWMVGPRTVVTAGHCVHSRMFFGGWAQEITVIPGRNGSEEPFGRVVSTDFSSLTQWVEGEDSDYDIGCIHLSESIGSTTGWLSAGALPADRLLGLSVNVSGYPSDRGAGTEQYHDSSRIVAVTGQRLYYELDTYGGQSGAPAWVQERPDAPVHVIGVHAYGPSAGAPPGVTQPVNSAPRLTGEVLGKIREWVTADGGWPDRGTNLGGVPSQAGDLLSAGDLSAIQDLLREALSGGRATPARSAL